MTHRSESESNVHRASHSIRRRVKARARAMTRVRLLRACQHIRARVRVRANIGIPQCRPKLVDTYADASLALFMMLAPGHEASSLQSQHIACFDILSPCLTLSVLACSSTEKATDAPSRVGFPM